MAEFTHEEIEALYKVMAARRDMRHFSSEPLPADLLMRLLTAAHLAPSVGLMQPWRFIHIRDRCLRERVHALVNEERARTAAALGEREEEFMRLKVEGILECGEVLVAGARARPRPAPIRAAHDARDGSGLRRLRDPEHVARGPRGGRRHGLGVVAVLCLGRVPEFYPRPMLEMNQWALGCSLGSVLHTDYWAGGEGDGSRAEGG